MHRLRRVFAAVALALVVAPLAASAPLFDPDEGLHAAIAQEMNQRGDYVTPTFLGEPFLDKPILFFWAEAASLRLFGDNEAAVRIPPLAFGLMGMLAVALLGGALFGEEAGLLAGIAYGTMLLPFGVSQVAVHDVGLIGFMCFACWCVYAGSRAEATVRSTALLTVGAGAALGLSILTKGLVGCVFATFFGGALALQRRGGFVRVALMLAAAGVVALLVAAPWYAAMEHAHPGYLHYYFVERHLNGYLTATQRHAGRAWWYYVPIVLGGALPWTGYLFAAATGRHPMRAVVWLWFVAGILFLSFGESKLVTYALPLFPAAALLAGDAVAAAAPSRALSIARMVHAIAIVLLPLTALAALQIRFGGSQWVSWVVSAICCAAVAILVWRATRAPDAGRSAAWMACATAASLVSLLAFLPAAASWMTSRDLAAAIDARGSLPPRISVVDERIGSLVFYLSPQLRAQVTPGRLAEASFPDALLRARVDPDAAIVAVRNTQLPRFNRLFPRPPAPDARAGTFTIFRALTLRETLQSR